MFLAFTNWFKTDFSIRKWNYPNRKWNYFSYFLTSDQKTSSTKCFYLLPTGCYRMTAKKFEHSTHSKMPHMSCKICHIFHDTGTFEYCVSKNYNILLKKYQRGKEIDLKNEKYRKNSKFRL